jgi:predicted metal-dependent hydrolase
MSAAPQEGEIVVRSIPFEFPDELEPGWSPHREWSHMVNGASLTMPYLEPFLIATLKEAMEGIDDDDVLEEARGFNAQEAQHYKTHRRYNELLKATYPQLAKIEEAMKASYDRLRTRSLTYRLAYSAGFETMTLGVTNWLVSERVELFGGSDTRVASFILWHFVEEAEHKRVAFDVYQATRGGYWQRLLGVFTGSFDVFWWSRKGAVAMLKADGLWRDPGSRLRLWRRTTEFFLAVLPVLLRSASPRHDPRDEPDPAWVGAWIAGYAARESSSAPLLDTDDPEMPVPFAARSTS